MQIHYAAKRGDSLAVLRQLARGISVDIQDEWEGKTALIWAAGSPNADISMLELLLQNGADINAASGELELSALSASARSGSFEKVSYLLQHGADAKFRNRNGYTALIAGAPLKLEITQLLIEHGADPNGEFLHSESALSVASRECDWATVRFLLESDADPAPLRWTPLIRAIVLGEEEDIKREINDYPDLETRDRWDRTPFLMSVCTGQIGKAKLLLDAGGNLNDSGRCGTSELQCAVLGGNPQMVEWLLSLGLSVNMTDDFQQTALMQAIDSESFVCAQALIEHGADVCATNRVSAQAINRTIKSLELVKLLLRAGADINYIDGTGCSLLQASVEDDDAVFVQALIDLGAQVDLTSTGSTALHAAAYHDARDVMNTLIAAGADPNAQDVDGQGVLWYVQTIESTMIMLNANVDLKLTDQNGRFASDGETDEEIRDLILTKMLL